jgi:hypothetical protein
MKFSWLQLFLGLTVCAIMSCEKEINIPLQESEPKLVVEGSIANDQQPGVVLTKTVGFFDKIKFDNIQFVTDAEVWVTDLTDNKRIQLFPITIDPITFYTIQNSDPLFPDFQTGKTNHTYKLEITLDNELYEATATIPACDGLDSLYFEARPRFNPENYFQLVALFTDPDTIGNYYKYFTKRNGNGYEQDDFLEPFTSRFDDVFINGKTLPADLFLAWDGQDSSINEFDDVNSYSLPGDTIQIKLSAMDAGAYDFWKTLEFAEGSVGNPFAAPIQVQSNVSNGAFGVWSGFGNAYNSVINEE